MRLGLTTEGSAGIGSVKDYLIELEDVLISSHAPLYLPEYKEFTSIRLNYASTDDEFRIVSKNYVLAHIESASKYKNLKQVNMHPSPKYWKHTDKHTGDVSISEGDYNKLIDTIREISSFAEARGIEIVLENNAIHWPDGTVNPSWEKVDVNSFDEWSFGSSPEEWIRICEDVDRVNVKLCLDSSHACTYALGMKDEDKEKEVMKYVSRPDLLRHVHWNDNYLYDDRGMNDSHAALNQGTLPTELHRVIKYLDATLLLEHFYGLETLEEELQFIDSL